MSMASPGAAVTVSLALAGVLGYAWTCRHVAGRSVQPDNRRANSAYAVAWGALAVSLATDAARLSAAFIAIPVEVYVALMQAKIIAMAAALVGFAVYVAALYAGRLRAARWWVAAGVVHGTYFLVGLQGSLPARIQVGTWATRVELLGDAGAPGGLATGLAVFFVPLLALAAAYGGLWRRMPDPALRRRAMSVIVSMFVFAVAGMVSGNPEVSPDGAAIPLATAALAGAAWLSMWAFVFTASDATGQPGSPPPRSPRARP